LKPGQAALRRLIRPDRFAIVDPAEWVAAHCRLAALRRHGAERGQAKPSQAKPSQAKSSQVKPIESGQLALKSVAPKCDAEISKRADDSRLMIAHWVDYR